MPFRVQPMTVREANAFVRQHHRHSDPVTGCKFAVGCSDGPTLHGVAICGRPLARELDDGWTLEVLRVCTDGAANACSYLYGACKRIGVAMGYRTAITYTLASEGGGSLRAVQARRVAEVRGKQWDTPSRPRGRGNSPNRVRWEL